MVGKFKKQEVLLPYPPVGNIATGASISASTACTSGDCSKCKEGEDRNTCCEPCALKIPANASSATTTLYRGGIPGPRCPEGWKTTTRPNGSKACEKDNNIIPVGPGVFSSSTKIFIKPSIPFEISYNGRTETINFLSLYHPCPVRIENVQYNAVLSIGDPFVGNRLIVLVPINSSNAGGDADTFISKITQYAAPLVVESESIATPVDAPTGSNWGLTQVIPVNKDSSAAGAFFTWNSSTYRQKVVSDTPVIRKIGWTADEGPQYIVMAEPIAVNSASVATIMKLPATPAESAIHRLGVITYKNAPPKDCKTCGPSVSDVLNQFQMEEGGAGSLSPQLIGQIVMFVFAGLAMLWALSVGVGWALDNVRGDMLRRWGVKLKDFIAKNMKASKLPRVPKSPLSSTPPA